MKGTDDRFGGRWIIKILSWCRWSTNNYKCNQFRHGGQWEWNSSDHWSYRNQRIVHKSKTRI